MNADPDLRPWLKLIPIFYAHGYERDNVIIFLSVLRIHIYYRDYADPDPGSKNVHMDPNPRG